MISRTLLCAMLLGVGSTALTIVSLATPTAAWVAVVPPMAKTLQQNESVVELAQVLKGPWTYSDSALRGVRANCKRRCAYRRTICLNRKNASSFSCRNYYSRCMARCETPGGPPLYPPPQLR